MVDRVSTHKYLGVKSDSKVCWSEYDSYIIKKANARLCCLRKLRSFGVSASVMAIFYNAAASFICMYLPTKAIGTYILGYCLKQM